MDDLIIPKEKEGILAKAEKEVVIIRKQYEEGLLTDTERRVRVINIWDKTKKKLQKSFLKILTNTDLFIQLLTLKQEELGLNRFR